MTTIALEEHCLMPELREALGEHYHGRRLPPGLEAKLLNVGAGRIAEMDAGGIDMQVLSTSQPGLEYIGADRAVAVARAVNDGVAAAVAAHPDRLAGFAALPTADPAAAAAELARAVAELRMVGAMVNGRTLERFLDDTFFWPIFESAEALGVPIYLHPMPPPKAVYDLYYAGFGDDVGFIFSSPAWGWHIETGLHSLRLMLAGVFDRFPGLQLIIGHMGEALPFMIERATGALGRPPGSRATPPPQRATALAPVRHTMELTPSEYFRRNFHVTTSGFFSDPPLRCAIDVIGSERVLFAVDYPYSNNASGRRFIDTAAVSEEERERIAHGNAERLLKL